MRRCRVKSAVLYGQTVLGFGKGPTRLRVGALAKALAERHAAITAFDCSGFTRDRDPEAHS